MSEPTGELEADPPASGYATMEEARAAILALETADYVRLKTAAKHYSAALPIQSEWEDLLQQAVKDTWKGTRTWNRVSDSTIVSHLCNLMRRLAYLWSGAYYVPLAREGKLRKRLWYGGGDLTEIAQIQSHYGNPETTAMFREIIDHVFELFDKDGVAATVIEYKMLGLSASEIMTKCGLSERDYEAIKKRINRKFSSTKLRNWDR